MTDSRLTNETPDNRAIGKGITDQPQRTLSVELPPIRTDYTRSLLTTVLQGM
jgi:hypothetical protein